MSKFNKKVETKTHNLAGGRAYVESPKLAFISLLLSSFLEDKFYESTSDQVQRLSDIISCEKDKKWLAQALIFARKEFGMRSVTHAGSALLSTHIQGEQWAKDFFCKIVDRPDDMGEILAAYKQLVGGALPNAIKKGFAKALQEMDAYRLAKYQGGNKTFKLIDIVNLVHPKATPALTSLVKGELTAETWEVQLSAAGGDEEKKRKVWHDLISENKLGYLALLRNLRNIDSQAPDILPKALAQLSDPERVAKARIFPFQFLTALENIESCSNHRTIAIALSQAIEHSLKNVEPFSGKTLVVVDSSGSMDGRPSRIASLFAAVIYKADPNAELMLFSDHAQYIKPNPVDSVMTIANNIPFVSGGTNFHSIFQTADKAYDRIIILSDMQAWAGGYTPRQSLSEYRKQYQADPKIYSFDLAGHGTLQFPEHNVYALAGWSDKALRLMQLLESDKNALINSVTKYII